MNAKKMQKIVSVAFGDRELLCLLFYHTFGMIKAYTINTIGVFK